VGGAQEGRGAGAPLTALGVDPASGRFEIPVGWLASLQAMWVIALSGVMAALWSKMGRFQPKAPVKMIDPNNLDELIDELHNKRKLF